MKMPAEKSDCTGCGACRCICPHDAIHMRCEAGGTYPEADREKCTECGLCGKVCPAKGHDSCLASGSIYPSVYVCRLKDMQKLKRSTSGGAFTALAREILSEGGAVFGAVSGGDFRVRISAAEDEEGIAAMQGSKYVESSTGLSFRKTEEILREGRPCLYSALPCQIAGLKAFLEMRGTDCRNLYTADLACHGTPSEKLYLSYLEYYESEKKVRLASVRHRCKSRGWDSMVPQVCAYMDSSGNVDVHASLRDGYLSGFLLGKTYKESCYRCRHAKMPRSTDFTIADFTGLGAAGKVRNDYRSGASQLLINTEKGKDFFNKVKDHLVYEERSLYEALFFNKNLWKPTARPGDSAGIYADFRKGMDWDVLRRKYFDRNLKNQCVFAVKEFIVRVFGAGCVAKSMYILKRKSMAPDQAMLEMDALFHD